MADVSDEFGVQVVARGAETTVVVTGELDLATCPILESRLDEALAGAEGDVRLDLGGVGFLDSTALKVLVSTHSRLATSERRLVLADPSAVVVRVLTVAGLLDLFTTDASAR